MSFAGLRLVDVEKDRYEGRESDSDSVIVVEGPAEVCGRSTATGSLPFFVFWRCNCSAFASALSCVRTKYAKFCRGCQLRCTGKFCARRANMAMALVHCIILAEMTYSYEELPILRVHRCA